MWSSRSLNLLWWWRPSRLWWSRSLNLLWWWSRSLNRSSPSRSPSRSQWLWSSRSPSRWWRRSPSLLPNRFGWSLPAAGLLPGPVRLCRPRSFVSPVTLRHHLLDQLQDPHPSHPRPNLPLRPVPAPRYPARASPFRPLPAGPPCRPRASPFRPLPAEVGEVLPHQAPEGVLGARPARQELLGGRPLVPRDVLPRP